MVRRLPNWRAIATMMLFGASGTLAVSAQEQPAAASKFKVLVATPIKDAQGGRDIGKDVAEEMRKLIVRMPRHEPMTKKAMDEAFRKFQLKEAEMNCISSLQLGIATQAQLVMCAKYRPVNGQFQFDSIRVIATETQEAYEIPSVTAATAKEVASGIFTHFERYIETIGRLAFCYQYLESNSYAEAITNCEAVLAINPQSARANMGKALAIFQMAGTGAQTDSAKLRESLALYRKVIELNPVEQEALRTAGIVAARLGMQEESRNYFKQYLELNPGDVSVRVAIASEQAKAGDPEGAVRVIEEGMKADTANTDLLAYAGAYALQAAYRNYAEAARRSGNNEVTPEVRTAMDLGLGYYNRLLVAKNGEVEPTIASGMIQTLVLLGRAPEAVEVGRRVLATKSNTAQVWAAYGGALANVNQTAQALAAYDSAIAKNDTTVSGLQLTKARVQLSGGDVEGARSAFRAAIAANQAKSDEVADLIIGAGLQEHYTKKNWDQTLAYLGVAGDFAESSLTKSKIAYWSGMVYIQRASGLGTPKNVAEARTALAVWQRALTNLEGGSEFGRSDARYNYAATLDSARKYIAYLNEVIKRG